MLSSFNSKGLCEQKRYVKRLKKYLCETYEHKVHYHKFVIDLHLNWDYKLLRYRSRCQDDIFPRIELFPLSSCQVIILIARMTFNCSTSCLMS